MSENQYEIPTPEEVAWNQPVAVWLERNNQASKSTFFKNLIPPINVLPPAISPSADLLRVLEHAATEYRQAKGAKLLLIAAPNSTLMPELADKIGGDVFVWNTNDLDRLKNKPLASRGSVVRSLGINGSKRPPEFFSHGIRPDIELRHITALSVPMPSESYDLIAVEQPQRLDARYLREEVNRLARPGALVIGVGTLAVTSVPHVNDALAQFFDKIVYPCLSLTEKRFFAQDSDNNFVSETSWLVQQKSADLALHGRWNPSDFFTYLASMPVGRRIEVSKYETLALWHLRGGLQNVLGKKNRKLDVKLPVTIRAAILNK